MSPRELELAYKGYRTRTWEQWEMVRYSSYYSMVIKAKKGSLDPMEDKIFVPSDHERKAKDPKRRLTPDKIMKVTKVDG